MTVAFGADQLLPFASELPVHAAVIDGLRRQVERSDQWRWLELSCSLASGRGDEHSDVDAAIGHTLAAEDLESSGEELVRSVTPVVDLLVHVGPGWPPESCRVAVEYEVGVQLDLLLMPASRRQGLPNGAMAIVDKDDVLVDPWTPPVAAPPTEQEAREWVMLGWWAISDTAKHLRRGSLFEAVERMSEARQHALRLFAASHEIPYPSFGMVSLLDFEPFELPVALERTYAVPGSAASVLTAALAIADLLDATTSATAETVDVQLLSPWAEIGRQRLAAIRPG